MTVTEVKSLLNNLANAHYQINDYGWGDVWEIGESKSITYPLMYCTPENSSISIGGKTFNFVISIIFADLVFGDGENTDEVISDQLLICQDILAQLKQNNFDFNISDNVSIEFFSERLSDLVAGVRATITMAIPYINNRCVVPSSYEYPSV